jgi:hypothetical protein
MNPFSLERRGWKVCILSGPTTYLAMCHSRDHRSVGGPIGDGEESHSAINSLADWRMAWMMRCPDLFHEYAIACNARMLLGWRLWSGHRLCALVAVQSTIITMGPVDFRTQHCY